MNTRAALQSLQCSVKMPVVLLVIHWQVQSRAMNFKFKLNEILLLVLRNLYFYCQFQRRHY